MSLNSTYSSDSHLNPPSPLDLRCFISKPGCWIFTTISVINVLVLLPLCVLILRYGFQQRFSSSLTTTTHSDNFTYHSAIMELIHILGCVLGVCGIYRDHYLMLIIWLHLFSVTYYGETFFHVLTCVEHYLAVVHPITYLSLRNEKWICIRNVVIACIWLITLGLTCLVMTSGYLGVDLCLSFISLVSISFCSLSVLYILTHPGPGHQVKERVRANRSKQRAFYTITAILGVLLLRSIFLLACTAESVRIGWVNVCMLSIILVWINLPGSLLLPLLYAHRTGMLSCLKKDEL